MVDAAGCPPQVVEIILTEVPTTDWAQVGVTHAERQSVPPPGAGAS